MDAPAPDRPDGRAELVSRRRLFRLAGTAGGAATVSACSTWTGPESARFLDCDVWYVDGSTGFNSNDGRTSATAKATVANAITSAGDNAPVLIRCANITSISLTTIRRRNRLHIMPTSVASPPTLTTVLLDGCTAVNIRGFKVEQSVSLGKSNTGAGGDASDACFDCVVAGNDIGPYTGTVPNAAVAVENQSQRCVVAHNEIHGIIPASGTAGTVGIDVNSTNGSGEVGVGNNNTFGSNSIDIQIVGNYIHDMSLDGITVFGWSAGLQVIGNYITKCNRPSGSTSHVDGMQIAGGPDILIQDNAVWDTCGGGGAIFVKDFYIATGLRVRNNTVWNIHADGSTSGFTGNGISLSAAPYAEIMGNIVYQTSGMTELEGGFGKGGGLALWGSSSTGLGDPMANERVPDAYSHDVSIIRNAFDCLHTPDIGASIAYRWDNWVYDPNNNGDHGYRSTSDLKPGDSFGGLSTTNIIALATYRCTTKLANEWRRDPFAFWFGPPRNTGGLSLGA